MHQPSPLLRAASNKEMHDVATDSNQLLDPHVASVSKQALDALLYELSRPENGTVYDRDYQTNHQNPWMDSRFEDEVPVKQAAVDLQTDTVDGHDRILPPRDKKLLSDTTQNEMKQEAAKDEEPSSHRVNFLASASYDFEHDSNHKIARKLSGLSTFKNYRIAVDNDSLLVSIPRRTSLYQFNSRVASHMEREISQALRVNAKFSHVTLDPGFDGIGLEFLLV